MEQHQMSDQSTSGLFAMIVVVVIGLQRFVLVDLLYHAQHDLCQQRLAIHANGHDILMVGLLLAITVRHAFVGDQAEGERSHFAVTGGDDLQDDTN